MNSFDLEIITGLNQFSQISPIADLTMKFLSGNHLFKGGILAAVFWWGWFRVRENKHALQARLISTLLGCFIAMILARALALLLPLRLRPLHEESLSFTLPYSMNPTVLEGWSSFPSDHAVLFYALSAGIFFISRKAGVFAIAYTTFFIGLPRVYLGLHYPTDIIVGAFIGVIIALLCQSNYFLTKMSQPVLGYSIKKPEIFYPLLFIVTFQIADMFNSSRSLISFSGSIFCRISNICGGF